MLLRQVVLVEEEEACKRKAADGRNRKAEEKNDGRKRLIHQTSAGMSSSILKVCASN